MVIVAGTGGSGSSYVLSCFKDDGWHVCKRPDKNELLWPKIFEKRTAKYIKNASEIKDDVLRMNVMVKALATIDKSALFSIMWGAMPEFGLWNHPTIFLFRDPVMTYNSFSGGGWVPENRPKMIQDAGATDANDPKWIELFFGDIGKWIEMARHALEISGRPNVRIIRYHKLLEDWSKLPNEWNLPALTGFKNHDSMKKVMSFLESGTVDAIKEKTNVLWGRICQL